jgi:hypothetical protein
MCEKILIVATFWAIFGGHWLKFRQNHLITLRVARWLIFKPKIPIWVNFGGSCNTRSWYIIWPFGLFYSYLLHLWSFGTLCFPILVCWPNINLATLVPLILSTAVFISICFDCWNLSAGNQLDWLCPLFSLEGNTSNLCMPEVLRRRIERLRLESMGWTQCDQIGRIFRLLGNCFPWAVWAPTFWGYFFPRKEIKCQFWIITGLSTLWLIFSQTHLVTLGEHSLNLEEWWGERKIFTPRGQSSPLGVKVHPLGSKLVPGGQS